MKNSPLIAGVILLILLSIIFVYFNLTKIPLTSSFTQENAITVLKEKYPVLKDYPSDNLPPKSIKTQKFENGWYVAFIQEGSGRPILSASCYFIDSQKNSSLIKKYEPSVNEYTTGNFSPVTCSPQGCSVTSCHGLEVQCGTKVLKACDAMYKLGDKCMQYAQCGIQNGKCQQIDNPKFTACKTCALACSNKYPNDPSKAFDCESKCE